MPYGTVAGVCAALYVLGIPAVVFGSLYARHRKGFLFMESAKKQDNVMRLNRPALKELRQLFKEVGDPILASPPVTDRVALLCRNRIEFFEELEKFLEKNMGKSEFALED